ncbi:hypothetical protein EV363DRAFT_1323055 [Boletus edulis]|nr:hypothetical protein EV363DRAFT_1323055 [Boletus edulis]
MLFASSVSKQTEDVLEDVLRTIREEYEGPYCMLCETDRNKYVEEVGSLRKQLKEAKESESNCSSLRGLLGLPSSPVSKCLKDAQELLQRVKEDINSKMRTRLRGKSNLPPPSIYGQGSARAPEQDGGHPLAEGNSEPDSALITSPLNMRCSFSEPGASDVDVSINPPVRNETVNETSVRNSLGQRHRRSPPSPPLRQKVLSSNSRLLPETSSDSGSDSSRRSSVRRPAPLPPLSPSNSRPLSEASSGSGSDSPRRSSVRRPAPPPPQSPSNSRPVSAISSDSGNDSPRRSPSVRRPAPPPPLSPTDSGSDSLRRSPSVRRPAPPPPLLPSNLRPLSEASSGSGSDSPRRSPFPISSHSGSDSLRRSPSVRRSPPSPLHSSRRSRTPRSPGNASFFSSSPGSPPLDPAMMSMITQQLNTLASSLATGNSRGGNGQWHTMMPPRMHQQVPPF